MKSAFFFILTMFLFSACSEQKISYQRFKNLPSYEKYTSLPVGSIKPTGWLKAQMEYDLKGFVGHLDQLVPKIINDPIYGSGRIKKLSNAKDWWNSESQSNWWDGYIRYAFLLDDTANIKKAREHVYQILATQDKDGYLGIYAKNIRYHFNCENGELWAKTTLFRGLLAYYEATHDPKVWNALVHAVNNVMENYPIYKSNPFSSGHQYDGGNTHGLTFTDILDQMYQLTGNKKYVKYALFLYENFSNNYQSDCDAQLKNILNPNYKLKSHGVHTYEDIRPLLVASTQKPALKKALHIYLARIGKEITVAGGPIGDEWIGGRIADPTNTGYEYCSMQELLDSYCSMLQKTGKAKYGDKIENTFYNAAQGSRNPYHSCIAYLKTDNSYEMTGTKNGEVNPGQTRYKYSPAHEDVAVCCVPNAGRITPYFLQNSWFKEGKDTLVAALLGPNNLNTIIQNVPVTIEEITRYPYENHFVFNIKTKGPVTFRLKVRKPDWVKSVQSNERYQVKNGYMIFNRKFKNNDKIEISFSTNVQIREDLKKDKYFCYGALVYAKPIEAVERRGREYAPGFYDYYYSSADTAKYAFVPNDQAVYQNNKIEVNLKNLTTGKIKRVPLIPIGKTILRQAAFK